MKKRFLSLIMALAMMVGVFTPLITNAAEGDAIGKFTKEDISETKPKSTKLYVHKLQSSSFKADLGTLGKPHDGSKLSDDQITALGKTPKPLNGVKFKYYKIEDDAKFAAMVKNPGSYKTDAQVTEYVTDVTGKEAKTATVDGEKGILSVDGQVLDLADGNYWFIETGYEKDTTDPEAPDNISSYIAVPFGITLPLTNTTKITVDDKAYEPGTVWLKNVHTYPKNVTVNEPTPDKTVGNLVNKHDTHNVGDTVTWYMNATIPTNIKDYTKFEFKDTLENMLDYVGNIEVKYDSGDKTEFKDLEYTLTANTHYTVVNYDETTRTFEVKLTKAGIAEVAKNIDGITNPKISVKFDTKLNKEAKVETGNPNEYTLKFNNGNTTEDKEKPSDKPRVFTGERKFVKTDSADRSVLAGAKFVVKNAKRTAEQGQYLKKDETTGAISWVKTEKEATVFTTETNGEINVGKLQFTYAVKGKPDDIDQVELYKTNQLNQYQLVETQAPKNYAKLDAPIDFEITPDSYKSGAVKIDQGKAVDDDKTGTHTEIKNKKLTIPQTGGIGTIIFTAIGLAIMASAVIAIKKRQATEAR
ncbi:SpaH/EbpB family LPXTG-anchored major pilin [Finegoldia sp. BIOML-A3]|uniref:SpaH/EbpB family LPXTG-anchored major pilin n=1 Tax=unclassified Finegoldia TaxID=2619637 RepID=UPI0012AFCCD7|nr:MULTISPECIES: SpaH/EbpB family LPXTG-anchored major pilin [unclassified Finegoldia]MSA99749.1 SpaH/EbpB family LPXTG-anchored major pilin [Finegoldia sp. BIOML-A3]MSB93735.1 SpaH/EbpB family LPXTG-anchored major pilin [Finegoldia sp. BIOML-A4]